MNNNGQLKIEELHTIKKKVNNKFEYNTNAKLIFDKEVDRIIITNFFLFLKNNLNQHDLKVKNNCINNIFFLNILRETNNNIELLDIDAEEFDKFIINYIKSCLEDSIYSYNKMIGV